MLLKLVRFLNFYKYQRSFSFCQPTIKINRFNNFESKKSWRFYSHGTNLSSTSMLPLTKPPRICLEKNNFQFISLHPKNNLNLRLQYLHDNSKLAKDLNSNIIRLPLVLDTFLFLDIGDFAAFFRSFFLSRYFLNLFRNIVKLTQI